MNENKSLLLTYLFSLIGGLFGLHHLYLGRTQHAFLWLTTFGGCTVGFIYEFLFLIKNYVHEANNENTIVDEYKLKMIRRKSPALEISRLCGQFLIAVFYGFITYCAFPVTWHQRPILSIFIACCSTIAIAFGTQITGTLGPRQCSFIWPLLGATVGMPFLIWHNGLSPSFNTPAVLSSLIFEWKIEWNPTYFRNSSISSRASMPTRRNRRYFVKRCLIFGLGVIVFSAIFTSAIYQNLQVNIKGRQVRINDLLRSHGMSSLFKSFSSTARELWAFYLHYGFKGIWMTIDSHNEKQAYEALNLERTASQSQIESQCRTLSRQWHPDRYRDPTEKRKAENKFLNIQQACDHLSNERKRRQIINTQKRDQ